MRDVLRRIHLPDMRALKKIYNFTGVTGSEGDVWAADTYFSYYFGANEAIRML